jgi:hypothetical protein
MNKPMQQRLMAELVKRGELAQQVPNNDTGYQYYAHLDGFRGRDRIVDSHILVANPFFKISHNYFFQRVVILLPKLNPDVYCGSVGFDRNNI